MPAKMARSAPRLSYRLLEVAVLSEPRFCLAEKPEKREYSRRFGSHLGNSGLKESLHGMHHNPTYGAKHEYFWQHRVGNFWNRKSGVGDTGEWRLDYHCDAFGGTEADDEGRS